MVSSQHAAVSRQKKAASGSIIRENVSVSVK